MPNKSPEPPFQVCSDLARIHDAAELRGGTCLSDIYQGMHHHYRLRCNAGHEWLATGSNIVSGRWCEVCFKASTRLTLDSARQLAVERGGQCLSTEYKGVKTLMQWSCCRGHVWEARFTNIRQGTWCRLCYHLGRSIYPTKREKYEGRFVGAD